MDINCYEIRREAREHLKGNWSIATAFKLIIAFLSAVILIYAIKDINIKDFLETVQSNNKVKFFQIYLESFLTFGSAACFLFMVRTNEFSFSNFQKGYTKLGTTLMTVLLMYIYRTLWTFLFVIPGIVAAYRYAMTPFLLTDNPYLGANEAITMSKKMMKGHKLELFVLHLTYIGWAIVAIALSSGIIALLSLYLDFYWYIISPAIALIAMAPVSAYLNAGEAVFYQKLLDYELIKKGQQEEYSKY